MIRFRLAELIADAQFKTGRRITLLEIADATGINRMTLSRMANVRGYSTSTDTIDKLCRFFACDVADIASYVDHGDMQVARAPERSKVATAASKPARKRVSRFKA
jgi:putative transcriptional regulator